MIPETDENGQPFLDDNNPDPSKRQRPILGLDTVTDMKWNGEYLAGGRLYDPRLGKTVKGKIWLEGENLIVRGYVGFLYATQTWERSK